MIRITIVNKVTGAEKQYIEEPFSTMRTRMIPYRDEAFSVDVGVVIVGSEMGTLVCKHKSGEVVYRNEQLGIESPMANLICKREITTA